VTTRVVGVGDCIVTNDPEAALVTYALGSCIAVSIYDPVVRVGGLLHFMLPESNAVPGTPGNEPYRYADTGTPLLFRAAYQYGAEKKRLQVMIAGGAAVIDDQGLFNIGKRNLTALRRILWKAGVLLQAEEVGGAVSRTVRLDMDSGRFWVRHAADKDWQPLTGKHGVSREAICQNAY
jgi:chemotaxis protein CheD